MNNDISICNEAIVSDSSSYEELIWTCSSPDIKTEKGDISYDILLVGEGEIKRNYAFIELIKQAQKEKDAKIVIREKSTEQAKYYSGQVLEYMLGPCSFSQNVSCFSAKIINIECLSQLQAS